MVYGGHPNTVLRTVLCIQLDMDEDIFPVALGVVPIGRLPATSTSEALLTEDELLPTRLNYLRWIALALIMKP